MRERSTRQVYCVACDLPVGAPSTPPAPTAQADGPAAAAAPGGRREATEGSELQESAAAAAAEAAAAAGAEAVDRQQPARVAAAAPAPATPAAAAAVEAPAAGPGALSPTGMPLSLEAALSGAQAALASKVREISALISATPASEVEALTSYTRLLAELLGVLRLAREGAGR
ncbi:hypothetical protein MNEG_11269 [Monoraphidium neglectum]|uniref:Uncharacterized protein n=1 Tax=Monoraphidium neglectum TaxID=145388 RepID=A0A0D2MPY3_9CHLO|nr:hypothetical protein MNEG_11269 [Monoraphidium neglectum]KIY96695.1 hypothetical protein MNEG_11269 [Monoraphidium neglectum]|eukprot:XP_013895715.1 hypothetical protein MNEG_11269 [Monoraphidium neglectum]